MDSLSGFSTEHLRRYYRIISDAISIRSTPELLSWLQGELQQYLPHRRLIAAWGDFASSRMEFEIIPALPAAAAEFDVPGTLSPFLQTLFERWIGDNRLPFVLDALEVGLPAFRAPPEVPGEPPWTPWNARWLLVHGITDARSGRESLYVMLGSRRYRRPSRDAMLVLLPYLDTILRRIAPSAVAPPRAPAAGTPGLSPREREIMEWVKLGKTNLEIASILGISAFTVKNHLRRIFKTLGVASRVQAAMKMAPPRERND